MQVKTEAVGQPTTAPIHVQDDTTVEWSSAHVDLHKTYVTPASIESILAQQTGDAINVESTPNYAPKIIEVPIMNSAGVQENVNVVTDIDGTEISIPEGSVAQPHQYIIQTEDMAAMVAEAGGEECAMQECGENMEEVTYILQVEDETGALSVDKDHEGVVMTDEEQAKIIEHLSGHQQVVYDDIQALVEVGTPGDGGGGDAQQYAVVMLPSSSGDEPEAALSMLQLQSGQSHS